MSRTEDKETVAWTKFVADYKALLAREICVFCRSGIHHRQLQGGPVTAACQCDCVD